MGMVEIGSAACYSSIRTVLQMVAVLISPSTTTLSAVQQSTVEEQSFLAALRSLSSQAVDESMCRIKHGIDFAIGRAAHC